jgi:hypothetical protein
VTELKLPSATTFHCLITLLHAENSHSWHLHSISFFFLHSQNYIINEHKVHSNFNMKYLKQNHKKFITSVHTKQRYISFTYGSINKWWLSDFLWLALHKLYK